MRPFVRPRSSLPLHVRKSIFEVRREVTGFLDSAVKAMAEPLPGSVWLSDLEELRSRNRPDLVQLVQDVVDHIGATMTGPAAEYVEGLMAAVDRAETLEHPALSMARSLQEIGMTLYWLSTSEGDLDSRLARWAGAEMASIQGALDIYESMDLEPATSETRRQLMAVQANLDKLGFTLTRKGRPRQHEVRAIGFGNASEPIQPRFSDLAAADGEQSRVAYAMLSGATHSRGWYVAQSGAPAATIHVTAIGQQAWLWSDVLNQIGAYTGEDSEPVCARLRALYELLFSEAEVGMRELLRTVQNPFAPPDENPGGTQGGSAR